MNPELEAVARQMAEAAARSLADGRSSFPTAWPRALVTLLRDRPKAFEEALAGLYADLGSVAQDILAGPAGDAVADDPAQWPWFRLVRRQHQAWERFCTRLATLAALGGDADGRRLALALRQWVAAADPDNSLATNPAALCRARDSGGASLRRGLAHLARDLRRGRIAMSDEAALRPGVEVASTPGEVVREWELCQLIRYRSAGSRVRGRPLLVVPPFINRFYVLDLQPSNSFVRFAVARGLEVYLVSWRNAGPATAAAGWDDYLRQGVLEPLTAVTERSQASRPHLLGHCIGGTLSAAAAAWLEARGAALPSTLTLLTTLLDFTEAGELADLVDEEGLRALETLGPGVVPAGRVAAAFSGLRPRELVWHFVVHNYLMGETPPVMDLLHWNGDGLDVPAPLLAQVLRQLYHENRLARPGNLQVLGSAVDLGRVHLPVYGVGALRDHIVPWQSAWAGLRLLGGRHRFALASGGHVAGVVCPPDGRPGREYRAGPASGAGAPDWLAATAARSGSWWQDWAAWIARHGGGWRTVAPGPPSDALEPAPGRYVLEPAAAGAGTAPAS